MKNFYLNFKIPHNGILKIANKINCQKLIFYLDLMSIAKGLYNKKNIFWEINHYLENNSPSNQFTDELRNYLNNIYKQYKNYNPFFILFYDSGKQNQNQSLYSSYKQGRSSIKDLILEDDVLNLYHNIKERYLINIFNIFNKQHIAKTFYLKNIESDLIPYYIISNKLYNSDNQKTLNVVFSNDKDLLQCCSLNNTIQITNTFFPSKQGKKFEIRIWSNYNAIKYIYKKFIPGKIDSRFIPLILALAGDVADNIPGIKGIGYKKAIDLIQNHNISFDFDTIKFHPEKYPEIIQINHDIIIRNLKLISFKEQIKRVTIE